MCFVNIKNELGIIVKYWHIYSFLSIQDLKSKFRRSRLGVLWIVIQQLVFALGAGIVWSKVFGINVSEFIPFVTIGMTIWNFIASAMTEGCNTFVVSHAYIKQFPLPQSIFILRTLVTHSVYFAIGLCATFAILIVFGKFYIYGILCSLPGFALLLLYFYGASGAMSYLGLRYRDVQHAITGIISLLFIITPVMYPPEILLKKGITIIIYGNPFASLIEIIRCPLLNNEFADWLHYATASCFVLILISIRFALANKWRRFIPFWS